MLRTLRWVAPAAVAVLALTACSSGTTEETVENADNVGAALLSSPGVRFNGALPKLRPASRLGQDTRQVLREAGLSEDEIAALLASRAAQAFTPPPAASPPGS